MAKRKDGLVYLPSHWPGVRYTYTSHLEDRQKDKQIETDRHTHSHSHTHTHTPAPSLQGLTQQV